MPSFCRKQLSMWNGCLDHPHPNRHRHPPIRPSCLAEVDDDVEPWYEYMGSPVGQGLVLVEGVEVVAGIFTVLRSS